MCVLTVISNEFLKNNLPLIIAFVVVALLTLGLLYVLSKARRTADFELTNLLNTNVDLYLERLTNNKLLKLVFRKNTILLFMFEGYIAKGDSAKCREIIAKLDSKKLEPAEKVEYLQNRISFFVTEKQNDEAMKSYEELKAFLVKSKAENTPKYKEILDECEVIINVYIEKNVKYIGVLMQKAAKTKQPVVRGVIQYRIARLAYVNNDKNMVLKYLNKAKINLKNTYYEDIVEMAILDNSKLED